MSEIERIREYFKGDVFATSVVGAEIEEIGEGYAKCKLNLDARHKNASGQVMGGVIFTLADFAFAVASNRGEGITVTTLTSVSFIDRASGNLLFAEAKALKVGKRNSFFEVSVTDERKKTVAKVSVVGTKL